MSMSSVLDELDKHLRNPSLSPRSLRSVIDSLNALKVVTSVSGEDQFDSFYRKATQLCKKVIEHPVFDMTEFSSVMVMAWQVGRYADRAWMEEKDKFSSLLLSAIATRSSEIKALIERKGGVLSDLVAEKQTLGDFLRGIDQLDVLNALLALELEVKTTKLAENLPAQSLPKMHSCRRL